MRRHLAFLGLPVAVLLVALASTAFALYEDEAGKDDWYYANLGMTKHVNLVYTPSTKKAFVASYHGIISALHLKGDGSAEAAKDALIWRQVLPDEDSLKHFQVHKNTIVVSTPNRAYVFDHDGNLLWEKPAEDARAIGDFVATISGANVLSVWALTTGKPVAEYKLEDDTMLAHLNVHQTTLYAVGGRAPSAEFAVIYKLVLHETDGLSKPSLVDTETHKPLSPSAFTINMFSGRFYVQLFYSEQSLYVLDLENGQHSLTKLKTLVKDLDPRIEVRFLGVEVPVLNHVVVGNSAGQKWLLSINENCKIRLEIVFDKGTALGANCDSQSGSCRLLALEGTNVEIYDWSATKGRFPDVPTHQINNAAPATPSNVAPIDYVWFWAGTNDDSKKISAHLVSVRSDWSISSVDVRGKLQWRRYDGLSNIQNAVFVDLLPTIHSSVSEESTFVQRLRERFQTQIEDAIDLAQDLVHLPEAIVSQIQSLLPSAASAAKKRPVVPHLSHSELLKKDRFGMHQMIVLVTGMGNTLVGMHTVGGRVVWERHFDQLDFLEYAVLIRRSVSLHPELFITAIDVYGFPFTMIINPLTGELVSELQPLDFGVSQVIALEHLTDAEGRHPVLVIDMDNAAHVYPNTEAMHSLIKSQSSEHLHFYLASRSTGVITGYVLKPADADSDDSNPFQSVQTWQHSLNAPIYGMRSAQVNTRSAARVNPSDKTLSLRHLNPNLVAIATVGFQGQPAQEDDEAKKTDAKRGSNLVNVVILDTVTGNILHRVSHKDCAGPVHLAFSENWAVYQYWNERSHRYEVASIELFEKSGSWGARQLDSYALGTANVHVEQQTYILQSPLRAMATTKTAQGITEKIVLFGLASGHVFGLSRKFLDPRRPEGQITPEEFAEGLVGYTPILPQHPGAYLNYYNVVNRLRAFATSPAALESTSLVLAYGLDVFFAPVAPNHRFYDRLSHGFSTALIFIMIAGLSFVTWLFVKLYRQKELKKAWK